MSTTFDVRFHTIRKRKDTTRRPFNVRWVVAGNTFSKSFTTMPLADGYRSKLVAAAKDGEPFDTATGLPPSLRETELTRTTADRASCYATLREYAEYKWSRVSAKFRIAIADGLRDIMMLMLPELPEGIEAKALRMALRNWAFNFSPATTEPSDDIRAALDWAEVHSPTMAVLEDNQYLYDLLDGLTRKHDGKPASARHFIKRRTNLSSWLKYAVGKGYLQQHPLHASGFFWDPPRNLKTVVKVDPRAIGNRHQVENMLLGVGYAGPNGPRFVAYFGCMYYAMMRPEEVTNLGVDQCELPRQGWGTLTLEKAAPSVGADWTDSGSAFEERELKHRPMGEHRTVPIPPRLVGLLRHHIDTFGVRDDGRLFAAPTGGMVGPGTYWWIWKKAREYALSPADRRGVRLRKPYNLRHSGVSMRLYAGVPAQQVADWAGHSLEMLLNVYSKVLEGFEKRWQKQIDEFMDDA